MLEQNCSFCIRSFLMILYRLSFVTLRKNTLRKATGHRPMNQFLVKDTLNRAIYLTKQIPNRSIKKNPKGIQ